MFKPTKNLSIWKNLGLFPDQTKLKNLSSTSSQEWTKVEQLDRSNPHFTSLNILD